MFIGREVSSNMAKIFTTLSTMLAYSNFYCSTNNMRLVRFLKDYH